MKKEYTLIFSGGHHNSALETLNFIDDNYKANGIDKIHFYWLGRKKLVSSDDLSPEYIEVSKNKNIVFKNFNSGKLYRARSIRYIPQIIFGLLMIPVGFIHAFYLVVKIKPDLIVSFGGYLGVPIVIVGKLLGVASVSHEQTAVIGLANNLAGRFSKKILISWPAQNYIVSESLKKKFIYTGLPLRKTLFIKKHSYPRCFATQENLIYVTGGKSGAKAINELVISNIEELTKYGNVYWQTGAWSGDFGYEDIIAKINKLPLQIKNKIYVTKYVTEEQISDVINSANLIITRGGAHIVYEMAALKKKAIIIPIPWASNNEQYANAMILKNFGLAEVIDQREATKEEFLKKVEIMIKKEISYDKNTLVPINGQERVANEIFKILKT